jgi:hypothetical protein
MRKVKHMDAAWKINYPAHNIVIMRDHNWAFSAWEKARMRGIIKPEAALLHVDFHPDYFETLYKLPSFETEDEVIQVGEKLQIFEFIKAAEQTGTIKDVYMIGDYEKPPKEVFHSYTYNQFENEYSGAFFKEDRSLILDLDLDFFNVHAHHAIFGTYDKNPFRYSDAFIKFHLHQFKEAYDNGWWDLITVAVSPEHCGGDEAAQELLDLFLEVFELEDKPCEEW